MSEKTALVVGADTPVGSVLAGALRRLNFEVVCVAHVAGATGNGLMDCDLHDPSGAASIIDAAAEFLGSAIDVLINVPTHCVPDEPATVTPAALSLQVAANAHMPIMLTQAFANQATVAARDSLVINVLSNDALSLPVERTSFVLGQTTLLAYTKIAAQALAPSTRVNALVLAEGCFEAGPGLDATAPDIERTLGLLLDIKTITGEPLVVDNTKIDTWRTPEHT